MRYIDKIGVELEGGWSARPDVLYSDGSVSIDAKYVGETCSQPFKDLRKLKKWLFKNYPVAVNESCGLHVHISLKNNLLYSKLMSKEFHEYFKEELRKFIELNKNKCDVNDISNLLKRLHGCNRFCKDAFYADVQANVNYKDSCRFTHINYCYRLHKTVEFRVLCMFKSKRFAFEAIKVIVKCVNEYLKKAIKEKEEAVISELFDDENENDKIIMIEEVA
jgi:hypothetical protein